MCLPSSLNSWLRLVVGSAKSNLGRWMGHMPPIWTILCMCFALGLPQILRASRAASVSPGGVYEKTRFRKNRKFRSQLFKPRCKIKPHPLLGVQLQGIDRPVPHSPGASLCCRATAPRAAHSSAASSPARAVVTAAARFERPPRNSPAGNRAERIDFSKSAGTHPNRSGT